MTTPQAVPPATSRGEPVAQNLHALLGTGGIHVVNSRLVEMPRIPADRIAACVARWGDRALEEIRRDPYQLLEVGVAVEDADRLHVVLGGDPVSLRRQTMIAFRYLRYGLGGSTWATAEAVERAVRYDIRLANVRDDDTRIRIAEAIAAGLREGHIVAGRDGLAAREHADDEARLARHVQRILAHVAAWPRSGDDEIGLSAEQRAATQMLGQHPFAILSGPPGSGKTHAVAAMLRRVDRRRARVLALGTTGAAAVKLTEALHRHGIPIEATTVHAAIESYPDERGRFSRPKKNETRKLDADLVIVDEASMLDAQTAADLFSAIPRGANVRLVGDEHQLPPVGVGAVLRDLIAAGVPTARLRHVHRHTGGIASACAAVCRGEMFTPAGNLQLIEAEDGDEVIAETLALVRAIGQDPRCNAMRDVQVITAGNAARKELNRRIQAAINPPLPGEAEQRFRRGDKVTLTARNHRSVRLYTREYGWGDHPPVAGYRPTDRTAYCANGDRGIVVAANATCLIARLSGPDRLIRMPRLASVGICEADLDLAYALTCHKAQGGGYPIVIVAVVPSDERATSREWLYTAVSRASHGCFVVGAGADIAEMIARSSLAGRRTGLVERLTTAGAI